MREILDTARTENKPIWQVVLEADLEERETTAEASFEKMRMTWRAMLESVEDYQGDRRSLSGLVGGDGQRMRDYAAAGDALCGPYLQKVIATALCVGESNACMRRIVAAPTAGACGVLPAVLVPLYQAERAEEDELVRALYVSAGIGAVISCRASIAGASGGCQAEIGSASAMAAGALTALRGGSGDRPCRGHGAEKSHGTGLRPHRGTGGGALCEAERHWGCERRQLRGHGPGRRHQPGAGRRGH